MLARDDLGNLLSVDRLRLLLGAVNDNLRILLTQPSEEGWHTLGCAMNKMHSLRSIFK
jgi:hypothetical protein